MPNDFSKARSYVSPNDAREHDAMIIALHPAHLEPRYGFRRASALHTDTTTLPACHLGKLSRMDWMADYAVSVLTSSRNA